MKKTLLLLVCSVSLSLSSFATVHIVSDANFKFIPDSIVINTGDSVNFILATNHNVQEVDSITWAMNDATPLTGGFSAPFGGGFLLPSQLPLGKHFYVCQPHADMGMKGIIVVEDIPSNVQKLAANASVSIYPNPGNGRFEISLNDLAFSYQNDLQIYNAAGQLLHHSIMKNAKQQVDLSNQPAGIYFLRMKMNEATITRRFIIQ